MHARPTPWSLVLAAALGAGSCAPSSPAVKATPAPKEVAAPEVDPRALCRVKAEVDDALARGRLKEIHQAFLERAAAAPADRALAFGAMLSLKDEDARWKAFSEDGAARPTSAVGPLGECLVYASWRMADQAKAPCAIAEQRLPGAALVEVARAELAMKRGAWEDVERSIGKALSTDPGCTPALVMKARARAAAGDEAAALLAWQQARAQWPDCFECAVESARIVEKKDGPKAALPHWEQALAVVPDSAETLKRYAAALAGEGGEKALSAYEKAISLGVTDAATLLAAAQLARGTRIEAAVGYAERAAKQRPDDIEPWRLLLALSQQRGDQEGASRAAGEILRLLPDDGAAHLVAARAASKAGRFVEAVVHYDLATAALAAGASGISAEDAAAARDEHDKLLRELRIAHKGPVGKPASVVAAVLKTAKRVFAEQKKQNPSLAGKVQFVLKTDESGEVEDVVIRDDSLGDPKVAAAIVGNLRRARIPGGGAKSYAFTMEFQ